MHSSYALDASDFTVERDGGQQPLADLWPGGYQPGDRLGVVLAQPMDAVGCSNLICATITLFYDYLRAPWAPATSSATATPTCSGSAARPATSTSSTSGRCTSG